INEVSVYPRLVVENALRYKAHSVALAHNHPGGTLRPSAGDVQLTKRLTAVLNEININVNDHIIVCGNRYISLAAKGMMF
ncbi:MAG: JAB domain-containing protein, partial [Clostridiales bacterium]